MRGVVADLRDQASDGAPAGARPARPAPRPGHRGRHPTAGDRRSPLAPAGCRAVGVPDRRAPPGRPRGRPDARIDVAVAFGPDALELTVVGPSARHGDIRPPSPPPPSGLHCSVARCAARQAPAGVRRWCCSRWPLRMPERVRRACRWCWRHPDTVAAAALVAASAAILGSADLLGSLSPLPASISHSGDAALVGWRGRWPIPVAAVAGVLVAVPEFTPYADAIDNNVPSAFSCSPRCSLRLRPRFGPPVEAVAARPGAAHRWDRVRSRWRLQPVARDDGRRPGSPAWSSPPGGRGRASSSCAPVSSRRNASSSPSSRCATNEPGSPVSCTTSSPTA